MISDLKNILKECKNEILVKSNLVSVGIGYKKIEGSKSSELAFICSVDTKKSLASLAAKDIIPKTIGGIRTDVVPVGMVRALNGSPTAKYRPALCGISTGHEKITAGTLGCIVRKNGTRYILSNNHVMANSNDAVIGDNILQPGPYDGGVGSDLIAKLEQYVKINFDGELIPGVPGGGSSCSFAKSISSVLNATASIFGRKTRMAPYIPIASAATNLVDCAIALPINNDLVSDEIMNIGFIAGMKEVTLGMDLQKMGRTTGYTRGTVDQIDVTVKVNYGPGKIATFEDQFVAGAMSQGGDSGSVVLDMDNNIVGLLFAGSDTTTIFNRIQNVFSSLNVTL